jgi:D-alanyl-D-alanine dipeptidase
VLELQRSAGNAAVLELLRPPGHARLLRSPAPPPESEPRVILTLDRATLDLILEESCVRLADAGDTVLPAEYVRARLQPPQSPAVAAEVDALMTEIEPRAEEIALDELFARMDATAAVVVRLMESQFILDPETSTLDLLPGTKGERYRNLAWVPADYLGAAKGPHEGKTKAMIDDLHKILRARRPHFTEDAVISEADVKRMDDAKQDDLWDFIADEMTRVPEQERHKLNAEACGAFVEMREAARRQGVELFVRDAHRSRETSRRRAAEVDNNNAVASFSAHNLGLAVDLTMTTEWEWQGEERRTARFDETTTSQPNVIAMRQSPVHKWLFLNARTYGWYPFHQEPWHWEYNPVGFKERFHNSFKIWQVGRAVVQAAKRARDSIGSWVAGLLD